MAGNKDNLYDPQWVSEFYDRYGEEEWTRLVKSPCAELQFAVHSHYLAKHLHEGDHVLEIGPGPGRFTQVMVERGIKVLAVDISAKQLELNRKNAEELGFAKGVEDWIQLDMCDLTALAGRQFDAVVAYGGPLSYVFENRSTAIEQIKSVLKPKGKFLMSVMSTWGSVHTYLTGVLDIDPETNRLITEKGDLHESIYPFSNHFCHMYRSKELKRLLEQHDLQVLDMSASHCLSSLWGDQLNETRQDEVKWAELTRMEIEASREPGCLDMGTHLIAVAQL